MSSIKQQKKKSPFSGFLPAIGLILALSFAVIAWIAAEPLKEWTVDQVPNFTGEELDPQIMTLLFAGFIFLVLMSFGSLLVAMGAPKKKAMVTSKELQKEKNDLRKEKRERKRRQQKMRELNRKSNTQNK